MLRETAVIARKGSEPASLGRFARYLRILAICCPVSCALASCASAPPPPPPPGPAFVINSPSDRATVSSATFFSVQPFRPADVQSVLFTAGSTQLVADAPGEDAFKVFLDPHDFPDGPLTLRATVTGKDGGKSEKTVTVNVLANPPSTATVTKDGAVLGTKEENGAVSTLSIPGGVAEGASVTFAARTKADVKAATGIDYDALGVTFLGAQDIGSTQSLTGPLGVTSGGFGPMVQPGQAVLNYLIVPDRDGDGIGELVAINTASVAPGGDVISNPVPPIQLGAVTAKTAARTQTRRTVQAGNLSGPPGTYIEIEAGGFNQFSALGNVAHFKSLVDDSEIELPAFANSHLEQQDPVPTIGFFVPVLPAGSATVTLKNVSTNQTSSPLSLTVETPPPLAKEPAVIIDETFAQAIRALSKTPEFQNQVSQLETVRSHFVALSTNPTPEVAQALNNLAVFTSNSNVSDLLSQIEAGSGSRLSALRQCSLARIAFMTAVLGFDVFGMTFAVVGAGLSIVSANPVLAVASGLLFNVSLGGFALEAGLLVHEIYLCRTPPQVCLPPITLPPGRGPTPPQPIPPSPGRPKPDSTRARQAPPPTVVTGMGSVVPPGGDSCGSAVGSDPSASPALRSSGFRGQSTDLSHFFGDLAGRFIVKAFYGAGNSVPFTGVSDSSGYFYIPTIPAGQPFEAIAVDTVAKTTRSVKGVGPEVGRSTYLFFDFTSPGSSGGKLVEYDTNTQGVYGGVDVYLFQGKAGDIVNLAIFSEQSPLAPGFHYQLSDANGVPLITGAISGGFYFETTFVELKANGLYTFTVDGSAVSGNYTLGLAKIDPPQPLDLTVPLVGNLATLGDSQFYTFTGNVNDLLQATLSHDSGSTLNADLLVREPLSSVPFYQQPVVLPLSTSDARRSDSGSHTLSVAGPYVLQVRHIDTPFEAEFQKYLGAYRVDLTKTP